MPRSQGHRVYCQRLSSSYLARREIILITLNMENNNNEIFTFIYKQPLADIEFRKEVLEEKSCVVHLQGIVLASTSLMQGH